MHDIRDMVQCRFYAHRNICTVRILQIPHNNPHLKQLTTIHNLNTSKCTARIIHIKNTTSERMGGYQAHHVLLEDYGINFDQVGDLQNIMCKANISV